MLSIEHPTDLLDISAGDIIFSEGDAAMFAYRVREGQVELRGPAGAVSEIGPGGVFGELSLIEDNPHLMMARTKCRARLEPITRHRFERLLMEDPSAVRVYLEALFDRLRTRSAPPKSSRAPVDHRGPVGQISVTIYPLTSGAAEVLPRNGLPIEKYPFRIGRAADGPEQIFEPNDLWLVDQKPFRISRNHLLIERESDDIVVKDRGSSLGTFVNDVHIGGKTQSNEMRLNPGDNAVVLGCRSSPYHFRIHLARVSKH